jgi:imidazolonepropionase-like amidohydrolase
MRSIAFVLMLAAGLPAAGEDLALQCGNVFDSKSARLVGARTIVVRADRIVDVADGRAAPAGARLVDLSAHTCSPGWIDLHVHLGQESNPKAYEERFRLDDTAYAFRSVGYAERNA